MKEDIEELTKISKKIDTMHFRAADIAGRNKDINQYLDNFYFVLMGLILGVVGGIWSNFINSFLSKLGTIPYLISLTLISLFVIQLVLKKVTDRARASINKNLEEFEEIKKETEILQKEYLDLKSKD